jgi:hypothetical protein
MGLRRSLTAVGRANAMLCMYIGCNADTGQLFLTLYDSSKKLAEVKRTHFSIGKQS